MTYVNHPDKHPGIRPEDPNGLLDTMHPPQEIDGLYYRTDFLSDETTVNRLITNPSTCQLKDYQAWVEIGWKTPQGTTVAVERFGDKLLEEQQELLEALKELENSEDPEGAKSKVISELGDVLWTAVAIGSNSSADLDAGMKRLIYDYVMGTRQFEDRQDVEPTWRPIAAHIATAWNQLSLGQIDNLMNADFVPQPSPAMNLYEPGDDEDTPLEKANLMYFEVMALKAQAQTQYDNERSYQTESSYSRMGVNISESLSRVVLSVAYIAHSAVDASLSDVASRNVSKIMKRIEHGRIDKSDGFRIDELK